MTSRGSSTKTMKWAATVEQGHKGCAIVLPFDPDSTWGARPRHFVRGTLNGVPIDAEIGLRWKRHFTVVGDDLLAALELAPGDVVAVALRPRAPNDLDPPEAPRLPGVRITATRRRAKP